MLNGVTGGIKENADRIISAIEKKTDANSGTKSDGQGDLVADAAKPQSAVTNANGSTGNTEASANTVAASDEDKKKNAYEGQIRLRLEAEKAKTESEAKKTNTTKQPSDSRNFVLVGSKKSSISDMEGTTSFVEKDSITEGIFDNIKKLIIPGFKKGGIVSVDDIEKQVHENGDDGLVSVKNGEWIVPAQLLPELQKLAEYAPVRSNLTQNMIELPKMTKIESI